VHPRERLAIWVGIGPSILTSWQSQPLMSPHLRRPILGMPARSTQVGPTSFTGLGLSIRLQSIPQSDTGGFIVAWAIAGGSAVFLLLSAVGLVDLVRNRHKMEGWQVVVWAAVIVLFPAFGLIAYLFWRLFRSEAMRDAVDFREEQPGVNRD
jgi:hypothetical protein